MAVDAGSIYSSVRIRLDSLDGDIKGVYARLDALESQITQKMDKPTKAVTASFNSMSLAGVAAFLGIGKAMKSVIGTSASFEQSMANVASVSGASTAQFDQLTAAAEKAGETTRYSASQAADALYALASAGFNATQATQALSGVLSLAQATGSDLGSTAESMAATISQYGLAATDAARVSNVFAAASATSQANMEKLTTGLRQVGPVAGSLGISLEETVANLDALYNKGFQGEQAGTALRSILLDLADSSSTVVQALEKQGLTYDQINPKTVGLSKAMENIANSGADLTTTFGKVAAAEAIALVQTAKDGTKNLKTMQEQITGTDYAAQSAKRMNDDLQGSIDELSSTAEATSIKFGKEFIPALRELASAAKVVVGWIGNLPAPLLAVVGSAAAVVSAIGAITFALSAFGVTISVTAPVLAGIALALTGISTAGVLVAKHFSDQQHVTEQLNTATEALKSTSDEYKNTQDELTTKAATLTAAEKEVLENRKKLLALDMQKKMIELSDAYDKANKNIKKQSDNLKDTTAKLDNFDSSLQKYKQNLENAGWTQEEVNKQVEIYKNKHLESLYKKQTDQATTLTKANTDIKDSVNSMAQAVADGSVDISIFASINRPLYNMIMQQVAAIKQQGSAIKETANTVAKSEPVLTSWQKALQSALNVTNLSSGANAVKEYTNDINTQLTRAVAAAKATGGDVASVYGDYATKVSDAIKSLLMSDGGYTVDDTTIQTLVTLMDTLKDKQKALTDATEAQTAQYKKMDDQVESLGNYSGATFDTMKKKLIELATEAQSAGTITADQADELLKKINSISESNTYTKSISDLNDMIVATKAGADAVDKLNIKMQHPDWSTEQIDEYIKKTNELTNATDAMGISTKEWQGYVEQAITGSLTSFEALGEAIATGDGLWQAFGASALNAIAQVIEGIGAELAISAGKQYVAAAISLSNVGTAALAPGQIASATKAAAESAVAYTTAGLVKGWASNISNMATGGIVEPVAGGTITRQAENGYGEVDYNVGPTGRAHTQQMGSAIAQELVNLGVVGSSGGQTINLVLDGKQIARVVTRRQNNGDY